MDAPRFANYCDKKAALFIKEAASQLSKLDEKYQMFFMTMTEVVLSKWPLDKAPAPETIKETVRVTNFKPNPVPAPPLQAKKKPSKPKKSKKASLEDQLPVLNIQSENSMEVEAPPAPPTRATSASGPAYVSRLQVRAARCNGVAFNLYHRNLTPHIIKELGLKFPTPVSREHEVSPLQYRDEMGLHTFDCELCAHVARTGLFRTDGGKGRMLKNLVTLHLLSDFDEPVTFDELYGKLFAKVGTSSVTDEMLAECLKNLNPPPASSC
jgi:hypothetical protein